MPLDLDSLYRSFGPLVLRRCRSLLKDDAAAKDAMHDVFVQLLRRGPGLEVHAPAGLLLKVATNVCLNRLRTKKRRPEDREEALLHAIAADPVDSEATALARRALHRLLGREPESTRLIAVLHHVDGLTLEEVAQEVGLSVSGVRKRLRGLQARHGVTS